MSSSEANDDTEVLSAIILARNRFAGSSSLDGASVFMDDLSLPCISASMAAAVGVLMDDNVGDAQSDTEHDVVRTETAASLSVYWEPLHTELQPASDEVSNPDCECESHE